MQFDHVGERIDTGGNLAADQVVGQRRAAFVGVWVISTPTLPIMSPKSAAGSRAW
jgi:hypothetical protein